MTQLKQSDKLGTAAQVETVNLTGLQGLGQTISLVVNGTADGSVEASVDGVNFFDVAGLQAITATTGLAFETPLAAARVTVNSTTGNLTHNSFTFPATDAVTPSGITTDGVRFYIIYAEDNTIHEYTAAGAATGFSFSVNTEVSAATDLVFYNGEFIVVDDGNNRVYFYDVDGTYTGRNFSTTSEALQPRGIATDGDYIYVVDTDTDAVYTYTMDGGYTGRSFSVTGGGTDPQAVLYHEGFLWVADNNTDVVTQYTLEGAATGRSFSVSAQDTIPVGFTHKDGVYVLLGTSTDAAYGYFDELTNSVQLKVLGK